MIQIENTSNYKYLKNSIDSWNDSVIKAEKNLELNPCSLAYKGILKNAKEKIAEYQNEMKELIKHQ